MTPNREIPVCEACQANNAYARENDGRFDPADLPFERWQHAEVCPWLERRSADDA